jgi:hypothetical protein
MRRLAFPDRAVLAIEAAGALVALFAVLLGPAGAGRADDRLGFDLSRASGTLSLADSRPGAAILTATNMRPGSAATGTVTVTDTGTLPATMTLAPSGPAPSDPAGALLASRLQLVVADVTDPSRPATVYSGSLAAMQPVAAGALGAGGGRSYAFTATLPASLPGAYDALQGASVTTGFTWTATAATPVATPTPPPAHTPVPTPPPSGSPTPTPTPTPSPSSCARRRVKIRLKHVGHHHVRRVTVRIGHRKHWHGARAHHHRIVVKVGPAKVKVRIRIRLDDGRVLHQRMRIKRCVA